MFFFYVSYNCIYIYTRLFSFMYRIAARGVGCASRVRYSRNFLLLPLYLLERDRDARRATNRYSRGVRSTSWLVAGRSPSSSRGRSTLSRFRVTKIVEKSDRVENSTTTGRAARVKSVETWLRKKSSVTRDTSPTVGACLAAGPEVTRRLVEHGPGGNLLQWFPPPFQNY